jgi:hypothetical protein
MFLRIGPTTKGDTSMKERPTVTELEIKIKKLEREALILLRNDKDHSEKMRLSESKLVRRTLSLLSINNELIKEMKEIKSADQTELGLISHKLECKIKELKCLYHISSLRVRPNFSMDHLLQEVVDSIPQAMARSEHTGARIVFNRCYEIKTTNFRNSRWKLRKAIILNGEQIGTMEVCCLEENTEGDNGLYLEGAERFIAAIADIVSQIVDRERAEIEIRNGRSKFERIIKQTI